MQIDTFYAMIVFSIGGGIFWITHHNITKCCRVYTTGRKTETKQEERNLKTIGLIGGMSWESTVTYYQMVNKIVNRELGGLHSAKVLL